MVATELHCSLEYVLYEMNYDTFYEYQNWISMYKFGYSRRWVTPDDKKGMKYQKVWDCENENFIDYVESEKHRYVENKKRNCYELPKGY